MSMNSPAADDIAAGQERISPRPTRPTRPMLIAIGTRSSISTNIAAKPSRPSVMPRSRLAAACQSRQASQAWTSAVTTSITATR